MHAATRRDNREGGGSATHTARAASGGTSHGEADIESTTLQTIAVKEGQEVAASSALPDGAAAADSSPPHLGFGGSSGSGSRQKGITREGTSAADKEMRQTQRSLRKLGLAPEGQDAFQKLPPFRVHPGWKSKLAWDLWGVFILVITVVVVPIRLAFDVEDFCPSSIWVVEAFIDVCFCLDLCVNFLTAVYVDTRGDGELELSGSLPVIAREYMRSWFIVDFVSSVPVDTCFSIAVHGCNGARAQGAIAEGALTRTWRRRRT